jgi:hypothetical protein
MHWQCAARCCVSCALTTKGGPLCCLGVFRCSSVSCVWKIASRSCRVANTVRSACSGSPNLATANARVRGWCVGMMSCDESGLRGHSAACQQSRVGGCYCPAGRCVDGGGGGAGKCAGPCSLSATGAWVMRMFGTKPCRTTTTRTVAELFQIVVLRGDIKDTGPGPGHAQLQMQRPFNRLVHYGSLLWLSSQAARLVC